MVAKKACLVFFLCYASFFLSAMGIAGGGSDEAPDSPLLIRVSAWDTASNPAIEQLARAFEKKNPGIRIDLIDIPSADYTNKLGLMLNGRSDLDVFWIKDGDTSYSLAQRGQLADLSAYVKRDGIDLDAFNGQAEYFMFGEGVYALPARMDYYVLYYNKDIFDTAGIPYPSNDMTWAEFERNAKLLSGENGGTRWYGAHIHIWQACVQNWAVADGQHTLMDREYSSFKPYYEMVLRMQNRDTSIMDYATLKTGNIHYSGAFLSGAVAMMPMGTWLMATLVDKIRSGESTLRWGVAPLPHAAQVPAGYTVGSVTPIAVNALSRKKDAAWEFVKFVTGLEGARIYAGTGAIPGRADDEILQRIASLEGMPEGLLEALETKHISLDRPIAEKIMEVNQALDEIHSLIMLGEISVDEGLARMGSRSRDIQSR